MYKHVSVHFSVHVTDLSVLLHVGMSDETVRGHFDIFQWQHFTDICVSVSYKVETQIFLIYFTVYFCN